jgi:hypothetical protein
MGGDWPDKPEDDASQPKKPWHTARRICDRLKEEHAFTGGCMIVNDYVPLAHPPGDARAGLGEALAVTGVVERTARFPCADLPHCDDSFVVAFPAENAESLREAPRQSQACDSGSLKWGLQ